MVKSCMLRMGYGGPLNNANYLKANFSKPYKFFIHSIVHALSHRKGGYDVMRDYQMNMVTALVLNKKYNFSRIIFHYMKENITSESKTWLYPRFVQMILDHAYPDLEKDENNDLLALFHMDNETLKVLARYHKNHPESSTKADFFGFIKDKNYVDPDPVDHLKWRNDKEIKEKSVADELKKLEGFKNTRSEWFLKEEKEKKKRGGKRTPKEQAEEGSSSQPKQKRQKKVVETMLVDESEKEDEAEADADAEGDHVRLSPESAKLLKALTKNLEGEKAAGEEGDKEDKSSSSSSESEIDETERLKRIQAEIEKEKQLKRKRREEKNDDFYIPSPEHVQDSQTPPSSGGRKKSNARKSVVSPKAARRKLIVKLNPKHASKPKPTTPPKQPTPPHETPPPSPPPQTEQLLSPPHQSPPKQSTPPHQSPIQEQPVITSSQIFQTPPSTQPQVQTTPGSSGFKEFPQVPVNIALDDIGDFSFVNDEQVKKLEKKVEEVLIENKKLVDREKET
ncbi:hypothetical protein HanRHA438_Chr07g0309741 [Helianthus annuus]|nr:hypothetical protein HanIR_Chr07g0323251 [Helianthus annuus]KAJ0908372.1 hypothetical protein HanRHA438_Chr07g0309741 [Helianthus annuus]